MPNLAALVLKAVEEQSTGTVNTSVKVFNQSYNVSFTGAIENNEAPNALLIGKSKVGAVLLHVAEALETTFFAGAGLIALSLPVTAPTDVSPASYYNLTGTITRL